MTEWDAPNQQVVRPDESPPWEEGEGGSTGTAPEPQTQSGYMSKAELLEQAEEKGLDVDDSMTRAEIQAALDDT